MKAAAFLLGGIIGLTFTAQAQPLDTGRNTFQTKLVSSPTRTAYDSLHFLVTAHYSQMSTKERSEIRQSLRKYALWSTEKLCADTEPGQKITISGRVVDEHNNPIPNAKLHIFQADNNGYYAPSDPVLKTMNEGDPRLFGFLITDKDGKYSFQTIRPASYPTQYNGRTIPQHIHINTTAVGYQSRNLQMAFTSDPAMKDPHWQAWARQQNYPVVNLQPEKGNRLQGIYDLELTKVSH